MDNVKVIGGIAALLLVLQLGGCSTTTNTNVAESEATQDIATETTESADPEQTAANDKKQVHCTHEKKIGSNRKFLRCFTLEEKERMREASRDAWLRSQRGSETGGG